MKKIFAISVKFDGQIYNGEALIEYKHTGIEYHLIKKGISYRFTNHLDIAERWKSSGKKVLIKAGHYFIDRIAIKNYNSSFWYLNDGYEVLKVSKFSKKEHSKLSENIIIGYL